MVVVHCRSHQGTILLHIILLTLYGSLTSLTAVHSWTTLPSSLVFQHKSSSRLNLPQAAQRGSSSSLSSQPVSSAEAAPEKEDTSIKLHQDGVKDNCKRKESSPKRTAKRERPRIPVIQYHDDWVCVSKPAGMTVHRSKHTPRRQLVLSTLLKRQLARKVFPVHRLDHRTSGAILFAFNSKTCALLHGALTFDGVSIDKKARREEDYSYKNEEGEGIINIRSVDNKDERDITNTGVQPSKKEYIALLRGDWKQKFGTEREEVIIEKPLNVNGVTKDAKTVFRLLASSPGKTPQQSIDANIDQHQQYDGACSLVLCTPKSGRTHQIRRHAYAMGFPIIGDSQHGDSKVNRWWRENAGLGRLFLHCLSLDLPSLETVEAMWNSKNNNNESNNDSKGSTTSNTNEFANENRTNDNRILCVAPLPDNLSNVLRRHDMSNIWDVARQVDGRLELVPYDDRGGTFGRNYRDRKKVGEEQ